MHIEITWGNKTSDAWVPAPEVFQAWQLSPPPPDPAEELPRLGLGGGEKNGSLTKINLQNCHFLCNFKLDFRLSKICLQKTGDVEKNILKKVSSRKKNKFCGTRKMQHVHPWIVTVVRSMGSCWLLLDSHGSTLTVWEGPFYPNHLASPRRETNRRNAGN